MTPKQFASRARVKYWLNILYVEGVKAGERHKDREWLPLERSDVVHDEMLASLESLKLLKIYSQYTFSGPAFKKSFKEGFDNA